MAEWYDYQRAVWDSKVPKPHRLMLLALAFHASAEGEGFPGNPKLAAETLSSTKTVRNHTADLEHHGLIAKVLRPGRSSIYRLNINAIAAWDGTKLDAWRDRPKRVATTLPTSFVDHIAEALETRLPDRVETPLPYRGGNQVADITTRVNNPGTSSNSQSGDGESDTIDVQGMSPAEKHSRGLLHGRQSALTLERRAEIQEKIQEELARRAQASSAPTTAPDSIPIPPVPDKPVRSMVADSVSAQPTEGAHLVLVKPCDRCGGSPARVDNGGGRYCRGCAPHIWNVA